MTDSYLREFLDTPLGYDSEYLPGSKRMKRLPAAPEPTEKEEPLWSVHPYTKTVKGKPMEFFSLEALCLGLDRPPVTIRLWERKGYIPEATYRMPSQVIKGKEHKGRRLYTRAQIQAVLDVCQEHGIRENKRVVWTKHHPAVALEIAERWIELAKEET